jgi:hypothetical protein
VFVSSRYLVHEGLGIYTPFECLHEGTRQRPNCSSFGLSGNLLLFPRAVLAV